MTDGVKCDLKSIVVEFIDELIIGVFMVHVECSSSGATIGIATVVKDVTVGQNIVYVDTIVKGNGDKLESDAKIKNVHGRVGSNFLCNCLNR